jgi:light-harvesting complex II chlorophyll a/b binding protein 4
VLQCRVDAGKVELDGARYLNFNLPFSISQLIWIEAILVGGAEIYRNRELDPEARIYPGVLTSHILSWLPLRWPLPVTS